MIIWEGVTAAGTVYRIERNEDGWTLYAQYPTHSSEKEVFITMRMADVRAFIRQGRVNE